MDDEIYFRQAAEKVLMLLSKSQNKPMHRNVRHLSMGEAGILRCLNSKGDATTAGELGRMMGIGSGGVANLLNSLEKKGYIIRKMSPDDRRRIMVLMTDSGKALIQRKQQEAMNLTVGLLTHLGKEDTGHLIRIYQKMLEIAEDYLKHNPCEETE